MKKWLSRLKTAREIVALIEAQIERETIGGFAAVDSAKAEKKLAALAAKIKGGG